MSTQETVSTVFISGCFLTFVIVLIVNVRSCTENETRAMLDSGHVKDGHGMWIAPAKQLEQP